MAESFTTRLRLAKYAVGDPNWGPALDSNSDTIDANAVVGNLTIRTAENPSTSLNVIVEAGTFETSTSTYVDYSGGTATLPPSTVTWLWIDDTGTLVQGTSYPTTNHCRLGTVQTGASTVTSVLTDDRVALKSSGAGIGTTPFLSKLGDTLTGTVPYTLPSISGTGVQWGTGPSQYQAWWGATEVVQQLLTQELITTFQTIGILPSGSSATPLDLKTGTLKAGNSTLGGTVSVTGAATFGSSLSAVTIVVSANETVGGFLVVGGSGSFGGDVTITGNVFAANLSGGGGGGGGGSFVSVGGTTSLTAGFAVAFDTITGGQIGTSPTQKLALWGSTAIVQPPASQDMLVSLKASGNIGTGSNTPLNLNGGSITAGGGTMANDFHVGGTLYASSISGLVGGGGSGSFVSVGGTTTMSAGAAMAFDTITGFQLGTSALQKLGLWGATEVIQQLLTQELITTFQTIGVLPAGSSATPLDLKNGTFKAGSATIANNVTVGGSVAAAGNLAVGGSISATGGGQFGTGIILSSGSEITVGAITAASVNLSGNETIGGSLQTAGNAVFAGNNTFTGTTSHTGLTTVASLTGTSVSGTTVNATSLTATTATLGSGNITGGLNVGGTLSGATETLSGDLHVGNNATVSGSVDVGGNVLAAGSITGNTGQFGTGITFNSVGGATVTALNVTGLGVFNSLTATHSTLTALSLVDLNMTGNLTVGGSEVVVGGLTAQNIAAVGATFSGSASIGVNFVVTGNELIGGNNTIDGNANVGGSVAAAGNIKAGLDLGTQGWYPILEPSGTYIHQFGSRVNASAGGVAINIDTNSGTNMFRYYKKSDTVTGHTVSLQSAAGINSPGYNLWTLPNPDDAIALQVNDKGYWDVHYCFPPSVSGNASAPGGLGGSTLGGGAGP